MFGGREFVRMQSENGLMKTTNNCAWNATNLNYQISEVIESGGSTNFNGRVPSVHCTCRSRPLLLLVTASTPAVC